MPHLFTVCPSSPHSLGCVDRPAPALGDALGRTCKPCRVGFAGNGDTCVPSCSSATIELPASFRVSDCPAGNLCQVRCAEGFVGTVSMFTCDSNFVWSGALPLCVVPPATPIRATALSPIRSASVQIFGGVAPFSATGLGLPAGVTAVIEPFSQFIKFEGAPQSVSRAKKE